MVVPLIGNLGISQTMCHSPGLRKAQLGGGRGTFVKWVNRQIVNKN